MILTLSALEGTGADRHRVTRTLGALDVTHASLEIWKVKGRPQSDDIAPELFKAYLPKAIANRRPQKVNFRLVGDRWMVVSWYDSAIGESLMEGTVFIHRSAAEDHFRWFLPPNNCKVDPKTGRLAIEHQGEILTFPADAPSWPDQMLDPEKYVAIGMLETLLTPDDENPLTMLMGADRQPYSGTARQLARKLTKIRDLFNGKTPDSPLPANLTAIMRAASVGNFPKTK